ncbi:hypothetical protein [Sinorhizobium chiapasense]|uniref:Uncharacterized protein n=1 Tax=Sinorhizobium chiapasense TaxID=501572 RepID=A0ABZ2BK99_9HYPH
MAGFVDEEQPLVRLLRSADDSEADERDNSDRLTKIAESLGCRPPNPPMRNLTFDYRQGFALRESWSSKASRITRKAGPIAQRLRISAWRPTTVDTAPI